MGGVVSYLLSWVMPGPSLDMTPDPVTGLNEQDCQAIRDTWALVSDRKTIKTNGVEFFLALFTAHPYMQDMFPLFRQRPIDELRNDPKMKAHATSVMYALGSYIGQLEDPETLAGLVEKIAIAHVARGTSYKDFDKLAVVFVKFMSSALGAQWTPTADAAWRQLFVVHNTLYRKIEQN